MELIFCGKRDARVVLVLYKYYPYLRDFVGICFDVETVCLLSKLHSDHHIEVDLELDELDLTAADSASLIAASIFAVSIISSYVSMLITTKSLYPFFVIKSGSRLAG